MLTEKSFQLQGEEPPALPKLKKPKPPVTVASFFVSLLLLIVFSIVVGYLVVWIRLGDSFDFLVVTRELLYYTYIFDSGIIEPFPSAEVGWLSSSHGFVNIVCNFFANWFGAGYTA